MKKESSYNFEVSISLDAYENKEIAGAMIGSCKDNNNKEIKKKYGFKLNKGITYRQTTITPSQLLEKLIKGHVICNLFSPKHFNSDGSFGRTEKCDDNFSGSYMVCVDIDKTNYKTVEDFIGKLEFKPTLFHTTYSNQKEGKGARFRLVYVFDKNFTENRFEYRYVAWKVAQKIENDTNEEIEDKCFLRCSQYYNGTNIENKDIVSVSFGCSDLIYSTCDDFGCNPTDYKHFLENYCYLKTKRNITTLAINNELVRINEIYFTDLTNIEKKAVKEVENNKEETIENPDTCSENLIWEMKNKDYSTFMHYNSYKYKYLYRKESDEWICGFFQIIDDDYLELFHSVETIKDGSKRRKKLFERMCLRRVMFPNISADNLLFNAYVDREKYFDNSDNIITIDLLVKNVERALAMEIEDIKKTYEESIYHLKAQAPKDKIIYKSMNKSRAEMNEDRKKAHEFLVFQNYNRLKSVKENIVYLNKVLPFEINKKTLYRYLKNYGLKTNNDEMILSVLDINLSLRKNQDLLKNYGINISTKKINKLLKKKKNTDLLNNCSSLREEQHIILDEKKETVNNCSVSITEQHTIMDDPFWDSKEETPKYDTSAFLGGSNFGISF